MSPSAPVRLLDTHVHVWSDPPRHPDDLTRDFDGSLPALVRDMDAAGVQQAWVVTPTAMTGDESLTEGAVSTHPTRLIGMARGQIDSAAASPNPVALTAPTSLRHARLDVRGLERGNATTAALTRFAATVPGVLAVHGDADAAPLIRAMARARRGRWTLVDHMGRPDVLAGPSWGVGAIIGLADEPDIIMKTPNLGFFSHQGFPFVDLGPVVEACVTAFGPDRVVWGSDWPLCTRWATYEENVAAIKEILHDRGLGEISPAVMGGTARQVLTP